MGIYSNRLAVMPAISGPRPIREEKEPRDWQTSYTTRVALAEHTSAYPAAPSIKIAHHLGKYEEDVHMQELT